MVDRSERTELFQYVWCKWSGLSSTEFGDIYESGQVCVRDMKVYTLCICYGVSTRGLTSL